MIREHEIDTGYNYAKDLLEKHKYADLAPLLKEANHECTWLEFKRDIFMREEEQPGETQDVYTWHIMKTILGFANAAGGCVLLGMGDDGKTVSPLRDKYGSKVDEEQLDKYMRNVDALLKKGKYTCFQHKRIISRKNEINFELYAVQYAGETVLAILVHEAERQPLCHLKDGQEFYCQRHLSNAKGETEEYPISKPFKPIEINRLSHYFNMIPAPYNDFVGRENELQKLNRLLSRTPRRIPLIYAPAGTGKTEFAFKYSEYYREAYDAFFFVRAEGITSIPQAFLQLAADPVFKKQFPFDFPKEAKTSDEKFNYVYSAVIDSEYVSILILFDNLDHPEMLHPAEVDRYLSGPGEEKLHLYATTRINSLQVSSENIIVPFPLQGLPAENGLELFAKKCPFQSEEEREAAGKIVDFFDGNAWAIDIIGEELKQRRRHYPDDYQEKWKALQEQPLRQVIADNQRATVRVKHGCLDVIALLKPTLNRLSPEALEFAEFASSCHPDYIYTGIFDACYSCHRREKEMLAARKFNDIIDELNECHIFSEYSIVRDEYLTPLPGKEYGVARMHRLTRAAIRSIQAQKGSSAEDFFKQTMVDVYEDFVASRSFEITAALAFQNVKLSDKQIHKLFAYERFSWNSPEMELWFIDEGIRLMKRIQDTKTPWSKEEKAFIRDIERISCNFCNCGRLRYIRETGMKIIDFLFLLQKCLIMLFNENLAMDILLSFYEQWVNEYLRDHAPEVEKVLKKFIDAIRENHEESLFESMVSYLNQNEYVIMDKTLHIKKYMPFDSIRFPDPVFCIKADMPVREAFAKGVLKPGKTYKQYVTINLIVEPKG